MVVGALRTMHLTVAIATWNRAALLRTTLESMTELEVPSELTWELLVCDNNSNDDTKQVVESFDGKLPVRYLFEPTSGKAFAIRRLAEETRSEWIVFTDDDVRIDPQWLIAYRDAIERYPDASLLGGQIIPWVEGYVGPLTRMIMRNYAWMHSILRFDQDELISADEPRHVYGPNFAFRTELLLEDGCIDTTLGIFGPVRVAGEDTLMVQHQLDRGRTGMRITASKVEHFIPPNRRGVFFFCRRQAGEGRAIAMARPNPPKTALGMRLAIGRHVAEQLTRALLGPPWRRLRAIVRGE